jgi:hypothetical protein
MALSINDFGLGTMGRVWRSSIVAGAFVVMEIRAVLCVIGDGMFLDAILSLNPPSGRSDERQV